jgi:hypothetical protein
MHYFIERMMSKDKELRYATTRELVDDIKEQIEGFRSLEYRAAEDAPSSKIMRMVNPGEAQPRNTTRRLPLQPPKTGTSRFSRLDEYKRRKK